jgi:hypothetical protein
MKGISPKVARLRLDPTAKEKLRQQVFTSRRLEMSVQWHDVES